MPCKIESSKEKKANTRKSHTDVVFMLFQNRHEATKKGLNCGRLTLSFSEKVAELLATRKRFLIFSFPRLATIRWLDLELSGIRSTGAPASMSRRILAACWAWCLT